ncbi:hypothetical protein NC651_031199 [Populus alba x Populus x berolinensis]|nr:hypothetical protein NC651_031199 [Populus alba x Populus x berolinensis]
MKTKAQNQSKFMRVMTIPVRVLCKARDVYVKSMTDFSMRMSNGPSMALLAGQHPPLPRSFSVGSSRITDSLLELLLPGAIDDDKSCVFEEVGVDVKSQLGPRSRSHAVGKGRNAF